MTNVICVESYNTGLRIGFLAGVVLPSEVKQEYLCRIHQYVVHGPAHWSRDPDLTRNLQASLVISLAATAVARSVIKTN
ncbi:MAG: hypothetical protein EXR09_07500 [Acetobacteraceae bacterium]|nr:hypothetical protein [Acetobacteraceae bacterium]